MTVTELRPLTIGASTFPALLGFDPFVSPYAAGAQLIGLVDGPEQSEAMRNGLRLQVAHAELVELDGYQVMPAPADGFVHPEHEWIVGHPDFFVALEKQRAPLELKLRGVAPSDQIKTRDVLQTFVYLRLLGVEVGMVSWLHGGWGGVLRDEEIVRDDDALWQMMVEHVGRIREGLLAGKLPAPDGSTSTREAIRERFATAEPGKTMVLSRSEYEHVKKIRQLDEVIATAKEQRERHAQVIQEAMGDATDALSPIDTPAARWRPVHSNRLDTKTLREEHPDLATIYTKSTVTRRFEVQ